MDTNKGSQFGYQAICAGAFLEKIGQPTNIRLGSKDDSYKAERIAYLLEEVNELSEAFEYNDEVAALDALADIIYIVAGIAAIYDLPLSAGFKEVHESNMTKNKNARLKVLDKGKGEYYIPPNLIKILKEYRNG